MLHSLSAQVSYYSEYIQKNNEWVYAGVYADFDETGTKENRPEFQRLLTDCRAGLIDIVLTKSISRFARNTVTLLETVRELKALGVDIWFEEQSIHTLSGDGELLLSILASYAQEESRSVSENIKWRKRNDMKSGSAKPTRMYGFTSVDGKLTIVPEEAEVIREMFRLYLDGNGHTAIANMLTERGVPAPAGGAVWNSCAVDRIIHNEKARGNIKHQTCFVVDHLSKRQVCNKGELPMYLVEGTHQGIINDEVFEAVIAETARRSALGGAMNEYDTVVFKSKIHCAGCGKNFWRTTNGRRWYKQPYWICGGCKGKSGVKNIAEDILKALTAEALGLEAFDGADFAEQIDHIEALPERVLVYHFNDGTEVRKEWQPKKKGVNHFYDGRRYGKCRKINPM